MRLQQLQSWFSSLNFFFLLMNWLNIVSETNNYAQTVINLKRLKLSLAILPFWHFGEYPKFINDRLSKIRLIVNAFNKKSHDILVPEKNSSLNESMMLWLGRLVFKQYIKNERSKYGIKFSELTTSDSYVLKIAIYSGKSEPDDSDLGKTAVVFINLINIDWTKDTTLLLKTTVIPFILQNI